MSEGPRSIYPVVSVENTNFGSATYPNSKHLWGWYQARVSLQPYGRCLNFSKCLGYCTGIPSPEPVVTV